MVNKLAWNTEGGDLGSSRQQIVSELTSYRPNWQFCLGDEGLAIQLLNHVSQGVILRVFDPFGEWTDGSSFDNEFWINNSPGAVVQYILNTHSHLLVHDKLVFTVGNNEPTTQGKTKEFVAWCVKLADLGKQHGIRFAIAEIASAKSINHDEVIAGVWDDLIRAMDKYRGFHIFTVHEYTTGILPATFLPDYPLNLNQPDVLHHDNWQNAVMNLSTIDGNWHLGRGALISHVRAKQIGIDPLPFVVTETAFDWMADVISTPERKAVVEPLRTAFKPLMHDALRGSSGHQMYHDWLINRTGFSGDWNDYLFAQYQWLVDVYPDECEGFCIFALNRDWNLPEGHDMSLPRNDKFRQLIINQETDTMPDPIPEYVEGVDYVMHNATVTSLNTSYIRKERNTTYSPDIELNKGTTLVVSISDKAIFPGSGYLWYRLVMDNEVFFVAKTVDFIIHDRDETTDIPDLPDSSIGLPEIEDMIQEALAPLLKEVVIDIPLPAFTMTIPELMVEPTAQLLDGIAGVLNATAQRLRSGTPTLSQIDAEIYGTPETNKVFTTLSGVGGIMDVDANQGDDK